MKKKALKLMVLSVMLTMLMPVYADEINGDRIRDAIIFNGGRPHKLIEGWYYSDTQMLTIEFQTTDFEPYTLTVESLYTTQQYYVTIPFVYVPIYVTDITINLELETDGGDLYWGSFEATSTGCME